MQYINISSLDNAIKIDYKDIKLFLLRDFFNNETLFQLRNEIKNKLLDETLNFNSVDQQLTENRKKAINENFPILYNINKNIHNDKELLNTLNDFLNSDFKSIDAALWWDREGYSIGNHIDNEKIKVSIQIYVGEENEVDEHLGTSFSYGDEYYKGINHTIFTLPYYPNSGYIYVNTDILAHSLNKKVPKNFNRFSLYFTLS